MLQAVKGYYEPSTGKIVLDEQPKFQKQMHVIVAFVDEFGQTGRIVKTGGAKLGGLEGKLRIPIDFDEPLDELDSYFNTGL